MSLRYNIKLTRHVPRQGARAHLVLVNFKCSRIFNGVFEMRNSTQNEEKFANMRVFGASGRRVYRVRINYSRRLRKIYHLLGVAMDGPRIRDWSLPMVSPLSAFFGSSRFPCRNSMRKAAPFAPARRYCLRIPSTLGGGAAWPSLVARYTRRRSSLRPALECSRLRRAERAEIRGRACRTGMLR